MRAGQPHQLPQPQAGKEGHFVKQSTLRRRHRKNGGDVLQGQGAPPGGRRGVEPAEAGQRVAGQVAAVDAPAAERLQCLLVVVQGLAGAAAVAQPHQGGLHRPQGLHQVLERLEADLLVPPGEPRPAGCGRG